MQKLTASKVGDIAAKLLLQKFDNTEEALDAAETAVETIKLVKGDNIEKKY